MSNERDELAKIIGERYHAAHDKVTVLDVAIADAILAAGYRKVFDGDCGLSNVKDPTDREATEAWMRWANLVSGEEPDGIAAMKQMLTEFGYRKPRTITLRADLARADAAYTLAVQHAARNGVWGHAQTAAQAVHQARNALTTAEQELA